jgi:hypothetical protein
MKIVDTHLEVIDECEPVRELSPHRVMLALGELTAAHVPQHVQSALKKKAELDF